MDGDLNGNGMKALALADKFVVAVLNAEEQQLLPALKKALKAELSALVQVKADCFKLFKSYNEKCEKIYSNIGYAIAELIQAIIGVHPDSEKKDKIETLFSTLDIDIFKKPTFNYANTAHALGKQILKIM
ncbi:hypothetical protein Q1695_004382 [Nippostrongylus brasiliensis]|nr:hypothetical protein Q1695_004382 [Nippostrongylus brasiliensis]